MLHECRGLIRKTVGDFNDKTISNNNFIFAQVKSKISFQKWSVKAFIGEGLVIMKKEIVTKS